MPLEFEDPDADEEPRPRKRFSSYDEPSAPWWRPTSTVGRVFLTLGALIVLTTLIAAVVLFKTYLQRDSRFRIAGASDIQATGLTEVSRPEMLPVFGEDIGRNIFFVPLNQRRKQLEAIPWVEHATVMRILPDQIRVSIVERQPVAFTREGTQIGLVDADGVLLSMPASAMARHHYSFPVVTGIDARDDRDARKARMAVYMRLMADLDSNGKHYSDQISEIDLTDPEDARVLMPEQGSDILAHFGEDHFLERFQRYQSHIAEWRQQYPRLSAVDLRYDQQVVLQMQSGRQDAEADPGASSANSSASPAIPKPSPGQPVAGAPAINARASAAKTASRVARRIMPSNSFAARSDARNYKPAQAKKRPSDVRRAALKAGKRRPALKTPQAAAGHTHTAAVMSQGG
jgi:cell division protein FtsQ